MTPPKIKLPSASDLIIPHRGNTRASKAQSIVPPRVNPIAHSLSRVPVVNNVSKSIPNTFNTEVTYRYKVHTGKQLQHPARLVSITIKPLEKAIEKEPTLTY